MEAYEVATADAAAESAAAAARATAANAGEIKAHASLPMTPLAVSSANVGRAAPVAAPVVAAPSAPSVAASAHHDANRNSYAQAEMTSEAASGIIFDTSIAKKIEHMHVLRSGSLDFSHSQPPPPPQPLPPALPPAEASGTPGVDHRVNTPVEAAAVVVSAAAPSAAVLPAGATTATLAAASADAPAAAEGAVGGPEDLGARIAALGGRARRLVDKKPNAVVVVGGSDGSGTRSVVALLEKLGVFMVVDDRGTNDVHAAEMGGWPPVVRKRQRDLISWCLSISSILCATVTCMPSGEPGAGGRERWRLRGGQVAAQRAGRHARAASEVHQLDGQAGHVRETARGEAGRRGPPFRPRSGGRVRLQSPRVDAAGALFHGNVRQRRLEVFAGTRKEVYLCYLWLLVRIYFQIPFS